MCFSLNGTWTLSSKGLTQPIAAAVPGNIELDLYGAGLEPEPFFGTNSLCYRKYACWDWVYSTSFVTPVGYDGACRLVFDAVDCFATYVLNGDIIGASDNAFIPQIFPCTLCAGAANTLEVRLQSHEKVSRQMPDEAAAITHMPEAAANIWVRKPGHSYGWDIAPKFNLGGIWRGVAIEKDTDGATFDELWVRTISCSEQAAQLDVYYRFHTDIEFPEHLEIAVSGVCGDSEFKVTGKAFAPFGHLTVNVNHPKLWEPDGYGQPNLYVVNAELRHEGAVVGATQVKAGIRTVVLDRSDVNIAGTGWFRFIVNGKVERMHGSNWVPADAFHSQDHKRVIDILKLFTDSHCNMLRVWGGGVYEDEEFYDYCDEHGILVWQDFMFSGFKYPQNASFLERVRVEAESVVRRLRRRTCLALWCGDNECDQKYLGHREDPRENKVNRQVLPEVLSRLDPKRVYLPSSPYLSDKAFDYADLNNTMALTLLMPERHLWGSRENFLQPFYTDCQAKFVSEMGWHGCPSIESMKRYIAPEFLPLDHVDVHNEQMGFHASNPWLGGSMTGRNGLMVRQNEEYYLDPPKDLPNFVIASQIHQAEAFKFVVEHYRLAADCGGILWWNIMDCWPQLSDAVVDYYFDKKLAYYYLKQSQQPFAIMCTDVQGHMSSVVAVNDTAEAKHGSFKVTDGDTGEVLLSGELNVASRGMASLGRLRNMRATNRLWLIEWTTEDGVGTNHFIAGNRVMSYAWYKERLPLIKTKCLGIQA